MDSLTVAFLCQWALTLFLTSLPQYVTNIYREHFHVFHFIQISQGISAAPVIGVLHNTYTLSTMNLITVHN